MLHSFSCGGFAKTHSEVSTADRELNEWAIQESLVRFLLGLVPRGGRQGLLPSWGLQVVLFPLPRAAFSPIFILARPAESGTA